MAGRHRLDRFKGSNSEYILYLERQLIEARRLVVQFKSTPRPLESPESRPQGSLDQPPDNAVGDNSNDDAISAPTNTPENHVANTPQGHSTSQHLQANDGLEFIPYSVTRVKPCKETAPWREELLCFLSNIPVAGLWPIKREELHLSSVRINQYVLTELFIDPRIFGLLADKLSPFYLSLFPNAILRSLSVYAQKVKTSRPQAKSPVQLFQFSDLVFVSMCKVTLHLGYTITVVREKMSEGFGSRHPKSLDRLLRGASWANKCISMLFDNEWKHRSTEAFLLCKTRQILKH